MKPPKPIVYFMIDREQYPNDRWLTVTGVIFWNDSSYSIEMEPAFCRADELQELIESIHFFTDKVHERTLARSKS